MYLEYELYSKGRGQDLVVATAVHPLVGWQLLSEHTERWKLGNSSELSAIVDVMQ